MRKGIGLGLIFLCLSACLIHGCRRSSDPQSTTKAVNKDDKVFQGDWLYRLSMGEVSDHPVVAKMEVSVNREMFRLVTEWTGANPDGKSGMEEWVGDGRNLWHILPAKKQVDRFELKEIASRPFWKMAYQVRPFEPVREVGHDGLAGRTCRILATEGKYDQGDVILNYWIDAETNVLLKKEHVLEAGGLLLVHETFECERIEYNVAPKAEDFRVKVPDDWVEVRKSRLDSSLLNTGF